jgi:AcrR family transcriptional regulator
MSLQRDILWCELSRRANAMNERNVIPRSGRDRAATEARLKAAVATLLEKGGFGALGPSSVAAEAGVDKKLIYRYFGGLEGLVAAVFSEPGFFPDLDELCAGDVAAVRALPPGPRARRLLAAYVDALTRRPLVLELMAWETVERNRFTALAESAREALGIRLLAVLFDDIADRRGLNGAAAMATASIAYLLVRRRKIRLFNGLDLWSEAAWDEILEAAERLVETIAAR